MGGIKRMALPSCEADAAAAWVKFTATASICQAPELTHQKPPLVRGRCLREVPPAGGVVASGEDLRVSTIVDGADDESTQGCDEEEGAGLPQR